MKRLFLAAMLWSMAAVAQQVDITGPQLLSGDADAQLQSLARQAASSGRKLVISAPEYWHELVLEQVRKGGGDNLEVEVRDSFAESVLVRAEDSVASATTPEPEDAVAEAPAPAPTPAPVVEAPKPAPPTPAAPPRPTPAPVAAAQPVVKAPSAPPPRPAPTPAPRPAVQQPSPAAPVVSTTPAPTPAPVAIASTPAPAPTATPAPAPVPAAAAPRRNTRDAEIASIKRRLEQNLNGGESVGRSVKPWQLEPGDVVYDEGSVKAVLRRQALRNQLFWIDGDLDVMRVELKELGKDRYQVVDRIREGGDVRLRAARAAESAQFDARSPTGSSDERRQLERRYNGGKEITAELATNQLLAKDIIYVGDTLAVVVRLSGLNLERYWLVGKVELGRSELTRDGANKYKVLSDVRN